MEKSIEIVAKGLGLTYEKVEEEHVDVYMPNFDDLLSIWFTDKEIFDRRISNDPLLGKYAYVLAIDFGRDDKILIPFVKSFLAIYPNMLVYNDETNVSGPVTFTKAQVDAFETNDVYDNFYVPPATK
ncbi:MAG TPA: hypothetical protein PLW44_07750 [Chitinophagales bacterium]|nr:hypothetical protein [Chitinophagales bacterium]